MKFKGIILLVLLPFIGNAQVKSYINIGTNFGTHYNRDGFYSTGIGQQFYKRDGSYSSKKIGQYIAADILFEVPLNNKIFGLSGLGITQAGYHNYTRYLISDFKATYISIPFQLRINFVNAVYLDVGLIGNIPVNAQLDEIAYSGTTQEMRASGNIASYLQPFTLGTNWQASLVINRFTISYYFIINKGNKIDNQLIEAWGLEKNVSIFLLDHIPKINYWMTGMKIGVRIL